DGSEDLFTVPTQQNDGLIFSAETPGEYTIGKIDAGDIEPWFVDMKTMEHIIGDFANFTGCALKTSGWARVVDSNAGIVVVPVTAATNNIVVGDIGLDITHADLDAGTLLDVIVTGGTNDYLWIRPDSSAAANSFDSTSGNVTCNAHTAPQNAAAVTGEMVWGNPYTSGALLSDTHIFIYQDGERVTSSDATAEDWWVDGHVDRAVPIKDYTTAAFPTIDLGYLTVKANQYGSKHTYSAIRMNTTTGGNVSAGLSSGADINNTTGYASITIAGGSGNWTVGDEISGDTSDARAIITKIDSPGATATLHYYLIGDPVTDFNGTEAISNEDDTGAASSSGAPADQGPALTTWYDGSALPTYAFANNQVDVSDDGTDEEYGVTIDLNQASLAQMHEYNKYTARRGSALDYDGLDGQEWIGLDYAINFASITGTVAEGSTVTGVTSGAEGVVVSNPAGTTNTALLRNSRGTFVDGEAIEIDAGNRFDAASLTVEVIVPVAESSFGTLAGTSFFASRGVVLTDYKSTEENNFSLIDATGVARARPTTITMQILNLLQYDYATCLRLLSEGGAIDKAEYSATGGEIIGDATLTVDGTIAADVPGKSLGGTLVIRDATDSAEYVLRYSSYVASTGVVTLTNVVIASATGATTTTINEAGAFASAKVGDLVYNHSRTAVSYISAITDNDNATINPAIAAQTTGDSIELNCCPIAVDTADDVAFMIVFEFKESDGSASASMQYLADIYGLVRVRNTSDAAVKIKGFTAAVTIGTGGGSASATRTVNTVYGS
ncbi:MAG: hypothetical protein QNL26_02915, partial [Acidimicrobiia bacterium]|nr:hypothetical protein [Acidimicrobiia bacterium]